MQNIEKLKPTGLFTNYIYKAIPLAFDESMSYYETLCGLLHYLKNTVIPTVNNNADAMIELQNLYTELHDYVEHYFDNLDVQEEINNKLDDMVEDGTLDQIIEQYLNSSAIWGFDTVADMKNATNLIDGSFAQTLGYYSKNDGGSALYKIRTITNDDVVDDAFIIALNDDTLIAELIIKNKTLSLLQIGCKNDNSIDNSSKIELIINKFKDGGKIYIPTGEYKINHIYIDENINNLVIEGQGFNSRLNNTTENWSIEFNKQVQNLTLNNFAIWCNNVSYGIKFNNSVSYHNQIKITNFYIRNATKGMYVRDIVYLNMINSFITITDLNENSSNNYAMDLSGYEYNSFKDCAFQSNQSSSFPLVILRQANFLNFDNCEFAYGGIGIKFDTTDTSSTSSNINIINSKLYNLTKCIDISLSTRSIRNLNILNNIMYTKGNSNTERHINIETSSSQKLVNARIKNNSFNRVSNTSPSYAINLGNDSINNLIVIDNDYEISESNYLSVGNNIISRFSDMSKTRIRNATITGDGTTKIFTIYNNDNALPIVNPTPNFITNIPDLSIPYSVKTYYNPGNTSQLRGQILFTEAPAVGTYTIYYQVI